MIGTIDSGAAERVAGAPSLTAGELASALGGRLVGAAGARVENLQSLDAADARSLTFIRGEKFARSWAGSAAAVALVAEGVDVPGHDPDRRALIFVREPDVAMVRALDLLRPPAAPVVPGVHAMASVDSTARVDPSASVGPFCVIGPGCSVGPGTRLVSHVVLDGGAAVGAGCLLHPHVSVLAGSRIGDRCTIHASAVIGADGFGYRPDPQGPAGPGGGLIKIPHLGNVVVENHVEIGACACIDRARFGSTTIGAGTKIDNLVQIAHNCRIGRCVVITGCTGIAGSVTIGDFCQLGGNVGIADNLTLGRGVRVAAKSGVMQDVPDNATVAGLPAFAGREYLRMMVALRKLASKP